MPDRKLRVAFVWDWPPEQSQVIGWQDGLAAAVRELQKRGHRVTVYMPDDKADTCCSLSQVQHHG